MQRYAIYLQTFQYDILYEKATEYEYVDALSSLSLRSQDLKPQLNWSNLIDGSDY